MKPFVIRLWLATLLVLSLATSASRATDELTPKTVLEVQPFVFELATLFSDAANTVLSDSSFSWTAKFRSDLAPVDASEVSTHLKASHGLLLYGSHGGATGLIGVEYAPSESWANDRMDYLTQNYFWPEELAVGRSTQTGTWMICFTSAYTNEDPAACEVAIIANCWGSSGGTFNATHRLAGAGGVTNAAHIQAYSSLMLYLMNQNYQTLASAHSATQQQMNQTGTPPYPWSLSGSGDIKFFPFTLPCEDQNNGLLRTSSACEDNPAAEISDFSYSDGVATWTVSHEWNTQSYLVEGSDTPDGEGFELAVDSHAIGAHAVRVAIDSFDWIRLMEIETTGRKVLRAICSTQPRVPPQFDEISRADVSRRREEIIGSVRHDSNHKRLTVTNPTCVVYAMPWLVSVVESEFAEYWNARGHSVEVVSMPYIPGGDMAMWLKGDIATYAASDGVRYFHLVGTWTDDFMSPLWHSSPYWQSKFDAYRAQGKIPDLPPDNIFRIPTFLMPDAEDEEENTSVVLPYIYSDRPFADTDDDGIPDVVVTRWPLSDEGDVSVACENMQNYTDLYELPGNGPNRISFFVSDVGFEDAVRSNEMVDDLVDMLSSGLTSPVLGSLKEINHPDYIARNVAAKNHLNAQRPDVLGLLGVNSIWRAPGWFFFRQTTPSEWDMSQIASGWFVRVVIAASCEAGKWVPWGPTFDDFVVNKDFLTTPDRGTVAWIGPTTGTLLGPNYIVEKFTLEELYANPYRPIAESWLVAMQRAYEFCEDYPHYIPTLDSYGFLGNPLSAFSRVPSATVVAGAQPVAACPAGDNIHYVNELTVSVDLENAAMVRPLQPDEVYLDNADFNYAKVFDANNKVTGNNILNSANGYTTTITHKAFGGCSTGDAVDVLLNGVPLSPVATVTIRTWDLQAPWGQYSLTDFAAFGVGGFPRSNVPNDCSNYDGDTDVDLVDFGWFSQHHGHTSQYAPANTPPATAVESNASVALQFSEEYPTATVHRLYVAVKVTDFNDVTTALFRLKADNPRLTFVAWQPAEQSLGTIMAAPVVRDGVPHVYFGALVSDAFSGPDAEVGKMVFEVSGLEPFEVAEDDFVMTYGEVLLESSGELQVAAQMTGVLERIANSEVARVIHNRLEQNFPNPFNPSTTLAFSLNTGGNVSLTIYDVAGRRVRELINERRDRGAYTVVWDGANDAGETVASGVYFYKLVTGTFTDTKKMTLLK